MLFWNAQNIRFWGQGRYNTILQEPSDDQILFWKSWTLRITFTENAFNFGTQNFWNNWKMLFSNAQNIRFWAQGSFKSTFYEAFYDQILI